MLINGFTQRAEPSARPGCCNPKGMTTQVGSGRGE